MSIADVAFVIVIALIPLLVPVILAVYGVGDDDPPDTGGEEDGRAVLVTLRLWFVITDEDDQVFSDAFLERQLVIAQGLFPHPDDRLFGRAPVPAEPRPGGV